ncbi:uncharacterized protein SPPG_09458 [Spizellomyces punctatus DAOM BR117]|uniref:Uncharacterized protein n=1 Tax=Spizellomyces punctatus (strain DAOM BR117) TaxID=645134 RepID=A0A0L0H9N1_SPIPD|nr:uncharacterized protein SPPG_09458 [Spizellomyces punctatus DAOM BR117]KNC97358.1 hypothetical protein SPPG_09458 [Spizellomyces punctatus DAOM BR117]|eukprot:XP_016605398.1 hypothetical protein SPPG_09458 [Spizellomyces punctatus DAOM BR117]
MAESSKPPGSELLAFVHANSSIIDSNSVPNLCPSPKSAIRCTRREQWPCIERVLERRSATCGKPRRRKSCWQRQEEGHTVSLVRNVQGIDFEEKSHNVIHSQRQNVLERSDNASHHGIQEPGLRIRRKNSIGSDEHGKPLGFKNQAGNMKGQRYFGSPSPPGRPHPPDNSRKMEQRTPQPPQPNVDRAKWHKRMETKRVISMLYKKSFSSSSSDECDDDDGFDELDDTAAPIHLPLIKHWIAKHQSTIISMEGVGEFIRQYRVWRMAAICLVHWQKFLDKSTTL